MDVDLIELNILLLGTLQEDREILQMDPKTGVLVPCVS